MRILEKKEMKILLMDIDMETGMSEERNWLNGQGHIIC